MCIICGMVRNIRANIDEDILDDEEKVSDFIHKYIDEDVNENSIELNIQIINKIFGSVHKAIKSYRNEYGDPFDDDEEIFYARLAFHAFYSNIDTSKIVS